MIRHPFGELSLGQTGVSSGRTMTETDVVNFCMLTGNWLELHSNIEHAKEAIYGQRLVQGSLVFSIVNAMIPFDSTVLAAFYARARVRRPCLLATIQGGSSSVSRVHRNFVEKVSLLCSFRFFLSSGFIPAFWLSAPLVA